jgi:hypothetical protein
MNRNSKRIVSIRPKRLARSPETHNRVSDLTYTIAIMEWIDSDPAPT